MNYKHFLRFELVCIIYAVIFSIASLLGVAYWYESFIWLLPMYTLIEFFPKGLKVFIGLTGATLCCLVSRYIGIPLIVQNILPVDFINLGNPIVESMSGMLVQLFITIYCITSNYKSAWVVYKKLKAAIVYDDVRVNDFYRRQESIRLYNSLTTSISIVITHFIYHMKSTWTNTVIYLIIVFISSMLFSYIIETSRTKRTKEILDKINESDKRE